MSAQRTAKGLTSWMEGRGIAIAVVVPLSLASFLLGYFVGKATTEGTVPRVVTLAVSDMAKEAEAPPAEEPEKRVVPESPSSDGPGAETAAPEPIERVPEPRARPEEQPSSAPVSATKTDLRKRMPYSVQIAAFQNRRDAEAFQRKYFDKGYNVYVLQTRTREQKTVYKVRVGRFEERKDAELMALKLKTLEGLTSFVTVQ
jgi:cell division septation protein DedD